MSTNFIEELKWRGLYHDAIDGIEELMNKERISGYIGFDPTGDSLHIGHFQQIMLLMRLQKAGHKPIALMGGATGRVGDPKMTGERTLLSIDEINANIVAIQKQLSKFIEFGTGVNDAILVNNFDWFKDFSFLDFIRDVGKHITVGYMMSKDSVQNRLETGISFTEFTYQLIQGYDFVHLFKNHNCKLQLGGSDQWGNITTGVELSRRMLGEKVYAVTSPLILRADGTKFGKSEGGENVWLNPEKTSPYKFYQFLLNRTDDEALNLNRRFSFKTYDEIVAMEKAHEEAPHLRLIQKSLADELTTMVHSAEDLINAQKASQVLFGGGIDSLKEMDYATLEEIFDGVPRFQITKDKISNGINIVDFLVSETSILPSNGQARQKLGENAMSINKAKISQDYKLSSDDILHGKMILVQQGKKNYSFVEVI